MHLKSLLYVLLFVDGTHAFVTRQSSCCRHGHGVFTRCQAEIDKGFNLLEVASKVVPQGRIVQTAKESWKFAWKVRLCFVYQGQFE